jgi:hypothetical protein
MSDELKQFLHSKGIATSRTTPYNPRGNGQTEKYNHIIWKSVTLAVKSKNLPITHWESVLPDVLHSTRSLLSTATNCTPHERLFNFQRKSASGVSLPTWLSNPGPVLLRRYVRSHKTDPLVDEVTLLEANPKYAHIRFPNGRESTVSLRDLAPCGESVPGDAGVGPGDLNNEQVLDRSGGVNNQQSMDKSPVMRVSDRDGGTGAASSSGTVGQTGEGSEGSQSTLRRSTRVTQKPQRLGLDQSEGED